MDLVITDEYYREMGKWIKKQNEEFNECVQEYCAIMQSVVDRGFMAGQTSEALQAFINHVKIELSGGSSVPQVLGSSSKTYCENYIQEVDVADCELY